MSGWPGLYHTPAPMGGQVVKGGKLAPQIWEYKWKHLPTGEGGTTDTDNPMTRFTFLELLSKWNSQSMRGLAQYIYWEV